MKLRPDSFNQLVGILSVKNDSAAIEKIRSQILSNEIMWQEVIALANDHLLTPSLWSCLSEKKLTEILPAEIHDYLHNLHELNTKRNAGLTLQAKEVIGLFNSIDVQPVLLKGSAYLFLKTFTDAGARIMYDLDFLIPVNKLQQSVDLLQSHGFKSNPEDEIELSDHHHWAPLYRPGDYGAVELHHALIDKSASMVISIEDIMENTVSIELVKLEARVLSPTHRVLHSILHSQVADRYFVRHTINLRSLYDLVNILHKDAQAIDWSYIEKIMKRHGFAKQLQCHLYNANILLGLELPENIHPTLYSRYHFLRSMAGFRWGRIDRLERDIERFSRYEILAKYDCENHWLPILKIRLQIAAPMLLNRTISFGKWLLNTLKILK